MAREANVAEFTIQILDIRPIPVLSAAGVAAEDELITYSVDNKRVYQIRLPKAEAAPDKIKLHIEREERERQKIIGMTWVGKS